MTTHKHSLVSIRPPATDAVRMAEEDLATLRVALVEAELSLNTLLQQLGHFSTLYEHMTKGLCEELTMLNKQILALCPESLLDLPDYHAKYAWGHSGHAYQTPAQNELLLDFTPSAALKDLYRAAAKQFHPDLAEDDADRAWRTQMMLQINAAFVRGDSEWLNTLLKERTRSPSQATVGDAALAEVYEKIRRVRQRLDSIRQSQRDAEETDLGKLYLVATATNMTPKDFIRDLVVSLKAEIYEKRAFLRQLLEKEPPP